MLESGPEHQGGQKLETFQLSVLRFSLQASYLWQNFLTDRRRKSTLLGQTWIQKTIFTLTGDPATATLEIQKFKSRVISPN